MATQLQLRKGTTVEHSSFTGANAEITVDTTKKTVVVHDGSTVGGVPLVKESSLAAVATAGTFASLTSKPTTLSGYGITDAQSALGYTPENSANKNTANGYAGLDSSGKVASAQLPSYVDDVLEYANLAGLPGTGSAGIIYVALDTGKIYRWTGSAYVEISPSPGTTDSLTEGSVNLYFTNSRAQAAVTSVSGNAGTATALQTSRTISLSTDATGSASFDGTANITIATTLATVNSNVGSFGSATASPVITVDGKGRITAVSNSTITPAWSSITSTPTTISGYGITDGVTLTGSETLTNKTLTKPIVTGILESQVSSNSGTTYAIDCSLGTSFFITLTGNVTFSFSNVPATANTATSITLFLKQDATGSRTVTWPASVKWPSATAPTITTTANKTDAITLVTPDNGTTWYGFLGGQNF
jgi:hypothetical protein